MEGSPFNRSGLTSRSPPPTPPVRVYLDEPAPEIVSTPEIQSWMNSIELCLKEVCTISSEGKLNSDQKLRISNLCRKVSNGTSQMAVQYQSLKHKTLISHSNMQALKEKYDLSQRIHELKVSIDESSKSSGSTSFAEMVKIIANNFIQPPKVSAIAIYPSDKQKTSEDTKSLVQKIISPSQMQLHVRGLRKTRNGGVIISTENKADVEKLKQSSQLKTSGLTVDEPLKRKPRIVIIGVPTSMSEADVFSYIYKQNLSDKLNNSTMESFLASTNLSHKSGKKDAETCNFIIEVSAEVRKALITKDRVFVNWSSCPVRDFTLVTRCYKCQQYGHAAKTCREVVNSCGHCGVVGHTMEECTKKAEAPKCATCLRFKKPCDHRTGDALCPAKLMAEKRYINSVDYEGA